MDTVNIVGDNTPYPWIIIFIYFFRSSLQCAFYLMLWSNELLYEIRFSIFKFLTSNHKLTKRQSHFFKISFFHLYTMHDLETKILRAGPARNSGGRGEGWGGWNRRFWKTCQQKAYVLEKTFLQRFSLKIFPKLSTKGWGGGGGYGPSPKPASAT